MHLIAYFMKNNQITQNMDAICIMEPAVTDNKEIAASPIKERLLQYSLIHGGNPNAMIGVNERGMNRLCLFEFRVASVPDALLAVYRHHTRQLPYDQWNKR